MHVDASRRVAKAQEASRHVVKADLCGMKLTCDKRAKDLDRRVDIEFDDGLANSLCGCFSCCCLLCSRLKKSAELHNFCKFEPSE